MINHFITFYSLSSNHFIKNIHHRGPYNNNKVDNLNKLDKLDKLLYRVYQNYMGIHYCGCPLNMAYRIQKEAKESCKEQTATYNNSIGYKYGPISMSSAIKYDKMLLYTFSEKHLNTVLYYHIL